MIAKADMHVHSKHSGRPSDWFLQKFGTNESYTEPEKVFEIALKQGMNFVTITDHNQIEGSLYLKEKYPDKVITGCEFTVYFPEDGCKAHLLTYGISREQFIEMSELRNNIYEIRDYIRENNIAYSLAHATYSVNGRLKIEHLEKLILLFDVFEGINGSRNKIGNATWMDVLKSLTPEKIKKLHEKHNIEPISKDPWIKGFTGGSDDHAALFIGKTYTEVEADSPEMFVEQLKNKYSSANGRHNDYRSFAFTLYKILYDFSKSKSKLSNSMINQISKLLFDKGQLDFIGWIKSRKIKSIKKKDKENFMAHLYDLIEGLQKNKDGDIENKFELLFEVLCDVSDGIIKNFVKSTRKRIKKQDYIGILQNVSSLLPSLFLSVPFFSTLTHMYSLRPLLKSLEDEFLPHKAGRKKKVLWFTDTINDLNGVSVTLKKIGWFCKRTDRKLKIVSSLKEEELTPELPPNFVNIPILYDFKMPFYESINLKIPSLLKAVEMLYEYEPDEVYISTPGPIGMLGLLFARLINARTTGVYHTDFTEQSKKIVGHDALAGFIESGTRWFFSAMDKIAVPTGRYIDLLVERGFKPEKLTVFRRGIDDDFLNLDQKETVGRKNELFQLIYAGRVSEDKNLDFLIEVFKEVKKRVTNAKLKIVGDGPYLERLKNKTEHIEGIECSGRVNRKKLAFYYYQSDMFVFPSNTDTFGMVVLEAQAAGLPAIVTDIGGPQEIVLEGKTGYIISSDHKDKWVEKIQNIYRLKMESFNEYRDMRILCRQNIIIKYDWEDIMQQIFEENPVPSPAFVIGGRCCITCNTARRG